MKTWTHKEYILAPEPEKPEINKEVKVYATTTGDGTEHPIEKLSRENQGFLTQKMY